ncbi:MAG: hypothetical protein IR160_11390 [Salinibacterium sp.]|nr:hypothetical protein [Salinibacterium sp.]MBF0673175.1 hypothetical protein [Salinibacterium sp.]
MSRGYQAIHAELRARRGSAVGLPCVAPGCSRLADGWALVGEATNWGEKSDSEDKIVRWSTDLNDYAPCCDSHNHQLDKGGDWLYCPRGHYRTTWGVDSKGECQGCRRERRRRLRADPEYRARETARDLARRADRRAMNHRADRAVATGRTATDQRRAS